MQMTPMRARGDVSVAIAQQAVNATAKTREKKQVRGLFRGRHKAEGSNRSRKGI